jgi:GNAT superfamily N-acetyltransferase
MMEHGRAPPPLRIAAEPSPDGGAIRAVEAGLNAHSAAFNLAGDWRPQWILGRDPGEAVQAGVRFLTVFDWLFVQWLWVAEAYRGQGVGSALLAGAENAAREKHCRAAYLDTFTFQAPRFYERRGYREFGRLNDFPPGHSRIWFSKRL